MLCLDNAIKKLIIVYTKLKDKSVGQLKTSGEVAFDTKYIISRKSSTRQTLIHFLSGELHEKIGDTLRCVR